MQLVKWDRLRFEIENARDWDEIKSLTDKVKAFQIWSKQTKQSLQTQNQIVAYRVKLEVMKGEFLNENVPHGGDHKSEEIKSDLLTLEKLGVSEYESRMARKMAEIPKEDLNLYIDDVMGQLKDKQEELSVNKILSHFDTKKEQAAPQEAVQLEDDPVAKVKEIIDHINRTFTPSERAIIVQNIKL